MGSPQASAGADPSQSMRPLSPTFVPQASGGGRPLSPRQARQLMDSAYLAAATALLWAGLYFLPIGSPFFRLALPLPLTLLQQIGRAHV